MFSLTELFDFFLPRSCISCAKDINPNEKYFCTACKNKLHYASQEFINTEFLRKFSDRNQISNLCSAFLFKADSPIQDIIHHLKYGKRFKAGIYLGRLTAEQLQRNLDKNEIDIFIPVPLYHAREADRGFNQSYYLAKGIGKFYGRPVHPGILKRIRKTKTQTKLSYAERQENMSGAFIVKDKESVAGKNIALVDDVITTGATIKECAKVLRENGAKDVIAVSTAITDI